MLTNIINTTSYTDILTVGFVVVGLVVWPLTNLLFYINPINNKNKQINFEKNY